MRKKCDKVGSNRHSIARVKILSSSPNFVGLTDKFTLYPFANSHNGSTYALPKASPTLAKLTYD